jgi:alkylhydroperoxidase family enzyme
MSMLVMAAEADLLAPPAPMRAWAAHPQNREWATVLDSAHAIAWAPRRFQPERSGGSCRCFRRRPLAARRRNKERERCVGPDRAMSAGSGVKL